MSTDVLKTAVRQLLPARMVTRIRLWRQERAIAAFPKRVVTRQIGDCRFRLSIEDGLGEAWYDHDSEEAPEITLLRRHSLKAGATVFDLGAHQGVVAMTLAAIVGPTGRVVAVEANSHNAAVARRNAELNLSDRLSVLHAAVAEHGGTLTFNAGLNGHADDGTGEWGRVQVNAVTIDGLASSHGKPNLVFVDVEGYEAHVLAGAHRTLAAGADFFIEMHVNCGMERFNATTGHVVHWFDRERYELLMLSDEHPESRPFDMSDPMVKSRFYLVAIHKKK